MEALIMQITRHGATMQTNGDALALGHELPRFSVENAQHQPVSNADMTGDMTLISVVPDINTRVCSISTKAFNQAMDSFQDISFYTISTNTVDQQQNWCAAEDVTKMQLLSDTDASFGRAMGLYTPDNGTDARSVWITNRDGVVVYREVITEQTDEPDYASALAFLETHRG